MRKIIQTSEAPQAIGPYSQGVKLGNFIFFSGQIALDPHTMEMVSDDITLQVEQVFKNMAALVKEAGGTINDLVKITIFLTDLNDFSIVNKLMSNFFEKPFPARSTIEVSALPKAAKVEIEAIMGV